MEGYGGLDGWLWGNLVPFASMRSTCFQPTVGDAKGRRFMNEIARSPNWADMGKQWARADLLFLKDSLERGMSLAEIAGFLGRTADEVREKAKSLNG
jgi:hypothetical protein